MSNSDILDQAIQSKEQHYFGKPPLLLRIQSMFIDTLVIMTLMFVAFKLNDVLDLRSSVLSIVFISVIALYEPICISLGQTLGQKIMGLKIKKISSVKNNQDYQNINLIQSIVRYLAKICLGWISLLTIHSDKYGQALHDKMGGSVMVYA